MLRRALRDLPLPHSEATELNRRAKLDKTATSQHSTPYILEATIQHDCSQYNPHQLQSSKRVEDWLAPLREEILSTAGDRAIVIRTKRTPQDEQAAHYRNNDTHAQAQQDQYVQTDCKTCPCRRS